jgi:hypothetical protein
LNACPAVPVYCSSYDVSIQLMHICVAARCILSASTTCDGNSKAERKRTFCPACSHVQRDYIHVESRKERK